MSVEIETLEQEILMWMALANSRREHDRSATDQILMATFVSQEITNKLLAEVATKLDSLTKAMGR